MSNDIDVNVNIEEQPIVLTRESGDVNATVNEDEHIVLDVDVDGDVDIDAVSDSEEQIDVPVSEAMGETVADHRKLSHRDAQASHPISAIEGLTQALSVIQSAIDTGFIEASAAIATVSVTTDGKNTVYHGSTEPTEQSVGHAFKVGDTWFNSSEDYVMYTWNGTIWVREQFGNAAFQDACIQTAKIANGAITAAKIADATITAAKIADAAITSAKIEDGAITNAKIANATITNTQIATGTILNANIANGTIQSAKIGNLDVSKLTGGYIDASHINASAITISEIKTDANNYAQITSNGLSVYKGGRLRASFGESINMYVYSNGTQYTGLSVSTSGIDVHGVIEAWADVAVGYGSAYHIQGRDSVYYHMLELTDNYNTRLPTGNTIVYGNCNPHTDDSQQVGSSSYRWKKIYCTDTTINTSDRKDKDNVGPIDFADDLIMALEPVKFMWKNGDHRRYRMGFIAQDVSEACNAMDLNLHLYSANYKSNDESGEGTEYYGEDADDEMLIWGTAKEELIAPMVKMLQEHHQDIETLKAKVDMLMA